MNGPGVSFRSRSHGVGSHCGLTGIPFVPVGRACRSRPRQSGGTRSERVTRNHQASDAARNDASIETLVQLASRMRAAGPTRAQGTASAAIIASSMPRRSTEARDLRTLSDRHLGAADTDTFVPSCMLSAGSRSCFAFGRFHRDGSLPGNFRRRYARPSLGSGSSADVDCRFCGELVAERRGFRVDRHRCLGFGKRDNVDLSPGKVKHATSWRLQ